jgi:hypothetical protein
MIGSWEVPRIERIATREQRRITRFAIPGLEGDLQQELGASSLAIEITGSLHSDEARDQFLEALRAPFRAGDPVTFTADITTATELEQVLVEALDVEEVAGSPDPFRYRIVLRQYVEPPAPPPPIDELGLELDADLDLLAALGLDGLELPDLLGDLPTLSNPVEPMQPALEGVRSATEGLTGLLGGLRDRLL